MTIRHRNPRTQAHYDELTRELKAAGIVPAMSARAAYTLGKSRRINRMLQHGSETTPEQRLSKRILARFLPIIRARGGETNIVTERDSIGLKVAARGDGLYLLRCEAWRAYSRRHGARLARLAYVCGRDDNGDWAVRVPGTTETIEQAVRHLQPAAVRTAIASGKRVVRQGDVYAIELSRDSSSRSAATLPRAHVWDATTRTLWHEPTDGQRHAPLSIPWPCKFVRQTALRMGRTRRRGSAD